MSEEKNESDNPLKHMFDMIKAKAEAESLVQGLHDTVADGTTTTTQDFLFWLQQKMGMNESMSAGASAVVMHQVVRFMADQEGMLAPPEMSVVTSIPGSENPSQGQVNIFFTSIAASMIVMLTHLEVCAAKTEQMHGLPPSATGGPIPPAEECYEAAKFQAEILDWFVENGMGLQSISARLKEAAKAGEQVQ